jgi:hypothetical protein
MHGDFSRSTFSARHGYRAVLLQQGRVLLDADVNEQADLTAHHDEVRTRDVVGRVGGPLPDDPTQPGPFAIRARDGGWPAGVAWADLVVTPGRYYVDGVVAESFLPAGGAGWPLLDQPFARPLPAASGTPGYDEPPTGIDRCALYLEVVDHDVTADEAPELLESALGGPDTTLRRQAAWQVKWAPLDSETCSDLGPAWLVRTPRTMAAGLRAADADSDPCRISASGGYRRLENQLYRVEVHEPATGGAPATFLWSRENGSVVAAATGLGASPLSGADARLSVDREGRDAELDIVVGHLIELTSTDRRLRRLPGLLARVVGRTGLDLDVAWVAAAPGSLSDVGGTPIVRRWENPAPPGAVAPVGATPLAATDIDLEDGLTVRFPAGGEARTGDFWLVPARSVRLAYGLSELRGTIEWPPPGVESDAAPPLGPVVRVAPLGIVRRTAAGWELESDCRRLFPPLTGLVTLDLVGGDGQEDLPLEWLDEPVRVVVRNGDRPVPGARVAFVASDGGVLSAVEPPAAAGASVTATTGADGVAWVRWRLAPGGPTTQVLTARRIDDHDVGVDVEVAVTGRLALASEVAFTHKGCAVFEGVATVEAALNRLAARAELRLQGGDGQEVLPGERVLRQPVRVIVDSPCGPVGGVRVGARATAGAHVRPAAAGEAAPGDLSGEPDVAEATTGRDGVALFWWQPGKQPSDTLELRLVRDDAHGPIVVAAQWEQAGGGQPATEGAHIKDVAFETGAPFVNDSDVAAKELASGVVVSTDAALRRELGAKPVARVELDLPWPVDGDGELWASAPVGRRTVVLDGRLALKENQLHWVPGRGVADWLTDPRSWLWATPEVLQDKGVPGRLVVEGWAILTQDGRALNTHATTEFDAQGRLVFRLPTDDQVAGGTFVQWFRLGLPDGAEVREVPNLVGQPRAKAAELLKGLGFERVVFEPDTARGVVISQRPAAGTPVTGATRIVLGMGLQ